MQFMTILLSKLVINLININLTALESCMCPAAVFSENFLTAFETTFLLQLQWKSEAAHCLADRTPYYRLFEIC